MRESGRAAGQFDEAGRPVPAAHRRVRPLEYQAFAAAAKRGDCQAKLFDSRAQLGDERAGGLLGAGDLRDGRDIRVDVLEARGFERDDPRIAAQPFRGARDDLVRHGADGAEFLRDDEVGREALQELRIERVQARAFV